MNLLTYISLTSVNLNQRAASLHRTVTHVKVLLSASAQQGSYGTMIGQLVFLCDVMEHLCVLSSARQLLTRKNTVLVQLVKGNKAACPLKRSEAAERSDRVMRSGVEDCVCLLIRSEVVWNGVADFAELVRDSVF